MNIVVDVNFDGDGTLDVIAQRRRLDHLGQRRDASLAVQVAVAVAVKVHVYDHVYDHVKV